VTENNKVKVLWHFEIRKDRYDTISPIKPCSNRQIDQWRIDNIYVVVSNEVNS